MKNKIKKILKWLTISAIFCLITIIFTVPANAEWVYPDGETEIINLASSGALNKTIYVHCKDTDGNTLKNFICRTKLMDYDVFAISLYGYDLVGFSSNAGIGETCKLTWASDNGSTAGHAQIGYQFYAVISKSSLTINLTFEKHEQTKFIINHYIVEKNGTQTKVNSSTETHIYGDQLDISKGNFSGYNLDSGYLSSITGTFTYDIIKASKNISSSLIYNYNHGSKQGQMYNWTSYTRTSKDYLSYCDSRVITVDFVYKIKKYEISFNVNGGTGTPSSITKYFDESITLPNTVPTRSGYTFAGWGLSSTTSTASYQAGETYTQNSSITLYAIWESYTPKLYFIYYDANGGSGAPVKQIKAHNVNLTLSGIRPTRTGYLFLGWSTSSAGSTVEYSPGDIYTENETSTLFAVWRNIEQPAYDFYPESIIPNASYQEGIEVISSFNIYNNGERDILSNDNCTVIFNAYYFIGTNKIALHSKTLSQFVIPANGHNLAYFKWSIPQGPLNKTVYYEVTVSASEDTNTSNNSAIFSNTVISKLTSQTADTSYSTAPQGFTVTNPPNPQNGTATWSIWVYENDMLVKKDYGIVLTAQSPILTPDSNVTTAIRNSNNWTIKSGYGIEISFAPYTYTPSGYTTAPQSAYTLPQSAYACFLEYGYSETNGCYCTLELVDGAYHFIENPASVTGEKTHFTPLWTPNGNYIVSVTATDCWTPLGLICTTQNSNNMTINGTIYDDWYYSRRLP